MTFEGAPSPDDLAALQAVLEMLEAKKAHLSAQRAELAESVRTIRADIRISQERQEELERDHAHWQEQAKDLPSHADTLSGQELQSRVALLKDQIATSKHRISTLTAEKERVLAELFAPQAEQSRRSSIRFIHHGLLNELSDLVRGDAPSALLQQKDKQIQLCEAIRNM
jgi:chromosome segregation ATPase